MPNVRRAGPVTTDPTPQKSTALATTQSTTGARLVPAHAMSQRPSHVSVALRQLLELPDFGQRLIICLAVQQMREREPIYWLEKAAEFEAAAPRLDEHSGRATRDELIEAWYRCRNAAALCRFHAELLEGKAA
jgi:hypothetical protein